MGRTVNKDHEGHYIIKGDLIAFRDTNQNTWNVNRIIINEDMSMTLRLVCRLDHVWQIEMLVGSKS